MLGDHRWKLFWATLILINKFLKIHCPLLINLSVLQVITFQALVMSSRIFELQTIPGIRSIVCLQFAATLNSR
jgi:hypothetical protein